MHRRAVLRTLLGASGLSLTAGCNGLFESEPDTATPRATTRTRRTTTAPNGPYRATAAPELDRPRGVHVRNFGATERFLTLVVRDDDQDVFVASRVVGAGESVAFPALVATSGEYRVVVETGDGNRRRDDWIVSDVYGDLWVELTPEVEIRRLAHCTPDCHGVSTGGEVRSSLTIPRGLSAPEALDRGPAIALDNGTGETRAARIRLWDGEALQFEYGYTLRSGVRAVVPIQPSRPRYRVAVRTDDSEATHEWVPGVRGTLYTELDDAPRFRCGFTAHDLSVRNETDSARDLTVTVVTESETLFEESFELDSGAMETVPDAVDPAGTFRFHVETDDGRSKTVDWRHCTSNGLLIVSVRDQGILVSVQPALE
jgi:hypothetical protein